MPQPDHDSTPAALGPIDPAQLSRRGLLAAGLAAAAGASGLAAGCASNRAESGGAGGAGAAGAGGGQGGGGGRAIRFAHFTDPHIRPEHRAVEGTAAAFRHLAAQPDRPELVVLGGDLIMHSMDQTEQRTRTLWDLWTRTLKAECAIPTLTVLGNHDVWGWNKARSGSTGSEPRWGKRWAAELIGVEKFYRSVDRGSWRIITLDTIQPWGDSYEGRIDPEQFAWLEQQLATAGGRHVCIITHIPILCGGTIMVDARPLPSSGPGQGGGLRLGNGAMMMDAFQLLALFQKYNNVKLVLSGHIHITERLDYAGIAWICSGAVSGMWWRDAAANRDFNRRNRGENDPPRPPRADSGYAMVDLFNDGTFAWNYQTFGWVPST
jgi:Icc protein